MSDNKHMPHLKNIFLTGLMALINIAMLIFIMDIIIWNIPPYYLPQEIPLWLGISCISSIMLLGALSPILARLYSHIQSVRITAAVCATIAVTLPYLIHLLFLGTEYIGMYLAFLISGLLHWAIIPLTLLYLISLILGLGEALYVEIQPKMLERWTWNIKNPATYILIPYYITLVGNIFIMIWLADAWEWFLPTWISVLAILYIIVGPLPSLWYSSPTRTSRGYLLVPLITMLLFMLQSMTSISTQARHVFEAAPPGMMLVLAIDILAILAFTILALYNPAPTPENSKWRKLGIICFYVAYIINGPWWALAFLADWM